MMSQTTVQSVWQWIDPWMAVMVLGRMLSTVAAAEALVVIDRGSGIDVWTVVSNSSSQTRRELADRQWSFMQVFTGLDIDFHILDRGDEPIEQFVRANECDMFIRLKANALS
jgi:hypothetical protein